MKKIKVIQKNVFLNLNFGIPNAELSKEGLSKVIGGGIFCDCRKTALHECYCKAPAAGLVSR